MVIVWILMGYLLGSIPSGVLLSRWMNLGDLRKIGSGNIGATNVLRTGNKQAAALTLVADAAKGALAVILVGALAGSGMAKLAALAAFVGHCWPVWLGFKGGKGVATYLGILLALAFPLGLAACATWAITAWRMRISSLSALVAAAVVPVMALFVWPGLVILTVILAALVFWRHADNITRLREGTEPRIGQR